MIECSIRYYYMIEWLSVVFVYIYLLAFIVVLMDIRLMWTHCESVWECITRLLVNGHMYSLYVRHMFINRSRKWGSLGSSCWVYTSNIIQNYQTANNLNSDQTSFYYEHIDANLSKLTRAHTQNHTRIHSRSYVQQFAQNTYMRSRQIQSNA